jgi:hypothetical protein
MKSSISRSGRLALHYAEENPDEVVVALYVIRSRMEQR